MSAQVNEQMKSITAAAMEFLSHKGLLSLISSDSVIVPGLCDLLCAGICD